MGNAAEVINQETLIMTVIQNIQNNTGYIVTPEQVLQIMNEIKNSNNEMIPEEEL